MAENEQPAGPPAVRAPNEPAPLDPEQVRQFQQFQQFQELMRQNPAGTLPAPWAPPPPKPLWQRILRSRLVRRLVLLAIIMIVAYIAYDHYLARHDESLPASITGGGRRESNIVADDNPYETVRKVYDLVAQNAPVTACNRFIDDRARQQFADDFGAPDCPAAIALLNGQVDKSPGSMSAYAKPDFHGKGQEFTNKVDTIDISSCEIGVTAGPRLGLFTLNRIAHNQWVITAHHNETC